MCSLTPAQCSDLYGCQASEDARNIDRFFHPSERWSVDRLPFFVWSDRNIPGDRVQEVPTPQSRCLPHAKSQQIAVEFPLQVRQSAGADRLNPLVVGELRWGFLAQAGWWPWGKGHSPPSLPMCVGGQLDRDQLPLEHWSSASGR